MEIEGAVLDYGLSTSLYTAISTWLFKPAANWFVLLSVVVVGWKLQRSFYTRIVMQSTRSSRAADPAAKYTTFNVRPGGAGNLDQASVSGDEVTLSGWAFLSTLKAPLQNLFCSSLMLMEGVRRVMATRTERPDVADYFQNHSLKMSGFTAVVKRQPEMIVTILQPYDDGYLYQCPDNFSYPQNIKVPQ